MNDGVASYPWFAADPLLEPIRQDPGYKQLMTDLRVRFEAAQSRYDLVLRKPPPSDELTVTQ